MIKFVVDQSDIIEDGMRESEMECNITLSLPKGGYHVYTLVSMFRDFLRACGYCQSSIDEYVPEVYDIEEHMDKKFQDFITRG